MLAVRSLARRATVVSLLASVAFALVYLAWPRDASAASPSADAVDCGVSTLLVERGGAVIFELPRQSGERLEIEPADPLTLRFRNPPRSGHADITLKLPFGQAVTKSYSWAALAPSEEFVLEIGPEDYGRFADVARGAYPLEVTTFEGDAAVCTVPFQVGLGAGISGPIGAAAAATTAAAAAGTVAAVGWMAGSARPEVSVKLAVERRRKRGWRRYVPVPSWKRTLVGSLMGTLTGVVMTIALQQGGVEVLTSFTLVRNVVAGALGSVSMGVAWGSVLSFIRKPADDGPVETAVDAGTPAA